MQENNQQPRSSGLARLEEGKISWYLDNNLIVQADVDDIVVIGEFTNADGPFFDDWYLTFVLRAGHWINIPWYADGIDDVLLLLCSKFHQDLSVSLLTNSTEWKSIVRFPLHLKNMPLFSLTPSQTLNEPKSFFQQIVSQIGFGKFDTTMNIDLTTEVKMELTNASR